MRDFRNVRALTFDVFGTVVDWRSGVALEGRRLGALHGIEADWEQVADAWRALYVPYMNRVRSGELPWTNFDRLHRMSLDQVLADMGIDGLDSAARDEFTLAWERLPAWPDASAGLATLTDRFTVATLSNGNRSQQEALMRFTGLPSPASAEMASDGSRRRTSSTTSPTQRSIWARRLRLVLRQAK